MPILSQFIGPHSALSNPAAQDVDFLLGQWLSVEWHEIAGVAVFESPDQQTFFGPAGNHHRFTVGLRMQHGRPPVELKVGFLILCSVAAITVANQQRSNVAGEADR